MSAAEDKVFSAKALKNADVMMAVGVVGIMCLMVLPLHPFLLDIFLTVSIGSALLILMVAVYTAKPLKFSVLPSLLLIVTLFRLSLNVASTRLILLHGNEGLGAAGHVIMSFGSFVVGGNFAVGLIVFLILVLINFVVITKGAGRIAEVSARFTLDAMPGKQMSIDADLNAGLINENEARQRRKDIGSEADFYGAMDGASKFIRGDAVAGLAITFINIIGGFFIGVLQNHMAFMDALKTYTILTIGDGLAAQIPALITSTAAGLIMTRAMGEANLGESIVREVFVNPKAILSASGMILLFGLVPGLPHLPFLLLGSAGIAAARIIRKREKELEAAPALPETPAKAEPERIESLLRLDPLSMEVGYGLISLADATKGGELQARIKALRKQLALELGIILPPIHVRDNLQLKPNAYRVLLKGNEIAKDEALPSKLMALDPGTADGSLKGIPAKDPAFGLPSVWIGPESKEKAKLLGYTVVDPVTVVVTHLGETIRAHAYELMGRRETRALLDGLSETHPKVVEELVPEVVGVGLLQKVLQNLLRERVSIRDFLTILETLAEFAPSVKDAETLTEFVRQALGRSITGQYVSRENMLKVITVGTDAEEDIWNAFRKSNGGGASLEPSAVQTFLDSIGAALRRNVDPDTTPVVLCGSKARGCLRRVIERHFPNLPVLSHNEIAGNVRVQSIGEAGFA
ncbi:MAG: flagellar biosynthesis protein FlhA [Nitrospirota bacterium]